MTDKNIQQYAKASKQCMVKIDEFMFMSELGRGYNSVVYLAKHK